MDLPLFHPASTASGDKLAAWLHATAQYVMVAVCGLLPILFIPSAYLPFSAGKTLILLVGITSAVLFAAMAMLKRGTLTVHFSLIVIGMWSVAAVTLVAALLSGDRHDSLVGDGLDTYTALFVFVMAATMTLSAMVARSKQVVIRLYGVLIFSALLLSVFHIARFIFGAGVLGLGIFTTNTASLIGNWNGLAIFYGLVVLLTLVALYQLPFSRTGRYVAHGVWLIAVVMLAIINFVPAWWVLAVVTGVFCLNHLVAGFWSKPKARRAKDNDSLDIFIATILIFIVSATFLVSGARLGTLLGNQIGISYFEVRPSLSATVEIAKSVYDQDLWLGAGPNRFVDVWRINKDPAINQTIFWNTPFDSGYSYVTTSFIGTGILGIIAYAVFFAALLWAGFRFLVRSQTEDTFWRFIGISALVASVYFWLMAILYVPPPVILLLAAVLTGIFVAASTRGATARTYTVSVAQGKVYGGLLVIIAVIAIAGTGYITYRSVNEVIAVYQFNKTLATATAGSQVDELDNRIIEAFDMSKNDAFTAQIAFHQLSRLRAILATAEPTTADQQAFQTSATRALEAAQTAVTLDPTNPLNHQLLGQVYAVLAMVGVEGAFDRARSAFSDAAAYDPHNPLIDLLQADLSLGQDDSAGSRTHAENAVRKKPNYTEALFFMAQLDINEGNVDRALVIVNGIAQLEPQNPARRYQLGVLLASADRLDEAVLAFEQAVALDPQYANARYFLALGYAEQGRVEAAIEQLTIVRGLNESNAVVDELIAQLRENGALAGSLTAGGAVNERDPQAGTVTEQDLESDLVTTSNPVASDASSDATAE